VSHDLEEEGVDVLMFPWELAVEEFVGKDSEGPDVALAGVVVFGKNLRRHVDGYSQQFLSSA
jgi:hypothetical protein